jgi:hypothetical protein
MAAMSSTASRPPAARQSGRQRSGLCRPNGVIRAATRSATRLTDAEVTLAVMPMLPGVLRDGRRGALDGCVPGPEVSDEGSEFGGTFERGEGA